MLSSRYKERFSFLFDPLGRWASKGGLRPNQITLLGLLLGIISALFFAYSRLIWAGVFLSLSGLCDILDGNVAREKEQVTLFGGFFDSTVDRYSDLIIYLGIMTGAYRTPNHSLFFWAAFALMGSVMVSYTRARAECIIEKCDVGLMERPERTILIILGSFFRLLLAAMVIIAIMANVTALHRIWHTYKALKDR